MPPGLERVRLRGDDLTAYAAEVTRLVRAGGLHLLFAHAPDGEGTGQSVEEITALFASAFVAERIARGTTTIPNGQTRGSAWLWLRRVAAAGPGA